MGQIIGLKAVHAGNPLPKGVKDAEAADLMKAFTKISQPYNCLLYTSDAATTPYV